MTNANHLAILDLCRPLLAGRGLLGGPLSLDVVIMLGLALMI